MNRIAVAALIFLFLLAVASADLHNSDFGNYPPAAAIVASETGGNAPLTVAFTGIGIDPEGDSIYYYWDFGDGTTTAGQAPVHTFMEPGIYAVHLLVEDFLGGIGTAVEIIEVSSGLAPVVGLHADKLNGPAPLTVAFTANAVDLDSRDLSYYWQMGDGYTTSVQNPVYTYNSPGTYTAGVSVTDPDGNIGSATETITVTEMQGAPTVAISLNQKNAVAPFVLIASAVGRDPEGQLLVYNWQIGNKIGFSNMETIQYAFYEPGTYIVSVTAVDPDDNTATATETVTVFDSDTNLAPSVSIIANPAAGKAPLKVEFFGIAEDPEGDELSFSWDFGDGTSSSSRNYAHTYVNEDVYNVKLTVTDSHGNLATAMATVVVQEDLAPSVAIVAEPETGKAPLTVIFTAFGDFGDDLTYSWDFDDNSPAELGRIVAHVFVKENSYAVSCTATDSQGNSATAVKIINVGPNTGIGVNMPPVAMASASPVAGNAPLVVSFTGIGIDTDGEVVSYYWDFGDGYSSREQNPVHMFNYQGVFNVQFIVTDDKGDIGMDTVQITVMQAIENQTTYTLNLEQGWNLVSLPLMPANNEINAVLGSLDYTSVWRWNSDSQVWESYLNGIGGEFSTLESGRGYWIYANSDDTVTVTGISGSSAYLNKGWNLAGYGLLYEQAISSTLSEIHVNSVWRWNAYSQKWESYLDAIQGGEFTTFEPGRGYWIYAENEGTWTY